MTEPRFLHELMDERAGEAGDSAGAESAPDKSPGPEPAQAEPVQAEAVSAERPPAEPGQADPSAQTNIFWERGSARRAPTAAEPWPTPSPEERVRKGLRAASSRVKGAGLGLIGRLRSPKPRGKARRTSPRGTGRSARPATGLKRALTATALVTVLGATIAIAFSGGDDRSPSAEDRSGAERATGDRGDAGAGRSSLPPVLTGRALERKRKAYREAQARLRAGAERRRDQRRAQVRRRGRSVRERSPRSRERARSRRAPTPATALAPRAPAAPDPAPRPTPTQTFPPVASTPPKPIGPDGRRAQPPVSMNGAGAAKEFGFEQ